MKLIMINKYYSINDVPSTWDDIVGDNIYMKKAFLKFMEEIDQCSQTYYVITKDNKIDTIFMTYTRPSYNLGMFTKHNIVLKMTLIYVPLSVTRPGIIYNECLNEALDVIKKIKGPKMLLNLNDMIIPKFAKGITCPKCILQIKWDSFEGYLNSLRSNYRYRYLKAMKKAKDLSITYLNDNHEFNNEMYECYLEVYNKSRIKVEKLPIAFFKGPFFKIFVLKKDDIILGFGQMLDNYPELIFEFVGINYQYNNLYDTYQRILLEILKYGIDNHYQTIDFGQTADEAKLKLGSKYTMLYAYLHHSNAIINSFNCMMAKQLSYKPNMMKYHIFKEEETL